MQASMPTSGGRKLLILTEMDDGVGQVHGRSQSENPGKWKESKRNRKKEQDNVHKHPWDLASLIITKSEI